MKTNNINAVIEEFTPHFEQISKRTNLHSSTVRYIDTNCTITLTTETYEKLGRKHFPRKATNTTTEEIDVRQYLCYLSSIGYFGDRVEFSYTVAGYITTKLTCTSPDKEKRIIRKFRIEHMEG